MAISHIAPVKSKKIPAIIKSNTFQFTSLVNCIDINGMSNRKTATRAMILRLFFRTTNYFINSTIITMQCNKIIDKFVF